MVAISSYPAAQGAKPLEVLTFRGFACVPGIDAQKVFVSMQIPIRAVVCKNGVR